MPPFVINLCLAIIGLTVGLVISGAVYAFITILGIVPRYAAKTQTQNYIKFYESAIVWGGILGTFAVYLPIKIPIGNIFALIFSLAIGVFYGSLAISLAEVLNVIPILSRRARIQKGLFYFVLAIALGKTTGSILYFVIPGFFERGM